MDYVKTQFAKSVIIVPLLGSMTSVSPIALLAGPHGPLGGGVVATTATTTVSGADQRAVKEAERNAERKAHAAQVDTYFRQRHMPLEGYGMAMVKAAEVHDLDWRLLPAIAVRESSGGKQMCGNNPFGWGSCKIRFKSVDAAIETLATNLGGDNPKTARYYAGDTKEKLHQYNGTVVPTYVSEVLVIMHRIGDVEVPADLAGSQNTTSVSA